MPHEIKKKAMKIVNLSTQNTILNQFLAEVRNHKYQTNRHLFRNNIHRIGQVMAYEMSRELIYTPREVVTPLATTQMNLPTDDIVVATVLRAGLPLQEGFLQVFDHASSAFVSAYRYYTDEAHTQVAIKTEYLATPALEGKTLILVDPMLATGRSIELAYRVLTTQGIPQRFFLASVIAAQEGIDFLNRAFANEELTLYTVAIDPTLNPQKYIVPGLGDAGDLCFGEKI